MKNVGMKIQSKKQHQQMYLEVRIANNSPYEFENEAKSVT